MVVSGFPRPCQSWLQREYLQNPPKVEIGADGVTCYLGEADDLKKPFCSLSAIVFRDAPFTEGSVVEGSGNNVLNNITPAVLRQAIKELRTQSHLTRTAINTYCRVDLSTV